VTVFVLCARKRATFARAAAGAENVIILTFAADAEEARTAVFAKLSEEGNKVENK